jgi:hypothetical protein
MRHSILAVLLAVAACGGGSGDDVGDDDDTPETRTTEDNCPAREPASLDLLDRLRAAPCVASAEELKSENPGYRAFDVRFTQLVDHQDGASGTFEQQVTVLAREEAAPSILLTTGYSNYFQQYLSELAFVLNANQFVVEHRYFNISIPSSPDWTQLTIANSADDFHQISAALAPIFTGAWLGSGASKGGMTSVYHRRFWPDDLAGTVPYVAPMSFGAPDYDYDAFVDNVGTPECRQALQDLEVELLTNRRDMLLQRTTDEATQNGFTYTRVAIGPAVESAVASIYWAWWQYTGVDYCDSVPEVTATDDTMWDFLNYAARVSGSADSELSFFDPYYYQAEFQLGYPGTMDDWLDGLLLYGEADYDGLYPVGAAIPTYQPEAMEDIDTWVQTDGDRLLFVYGEWDPWTGGKYELGDAADSALFVVPQGTHGASLVDLPTADRDAASAMLEEWTGVAPQFPQQAAFAPRPRANEPRIPPAALQAWRLRAAAR